MPWLRAVLEIIFAAYQIIFRDEFFILELFEFIVRIAADVADRHFGFFETPAHKTDQILAAFFAEPGDGQPDQLAVIARRQSQVRL